MRVRVFALLAVLAVLLSLAIPARAQTRCPGGATNINPASNWQSIINASAAGTVYCLADGTYFPQYIQLKDGDSVIASSVHGAILDGQNQQRQAFVSTFAYASTGNIDNVTIDGIVVRNFLSANPYVTAAIEAGVGWQVKNIVAHNNTTALMFSKANWACAQGALVEYSTFYNNTHMAMQWNGTSATFRHLTFRNNGWSAAANDAFWYGSIKITNNPVAANTINCPQAANLTVNTSFIRSFGNRTAGWWQDENIRNFVFEQSYIAFNERWGFVQEIGFGGIVRNNTFECNKATLGSDGSGWSGSNISIMNSSGVTVEGNVVRVCPSGYSATIDGVTYTTTTTGRGIVLMDEDHRNFSYTFDTPREMRNITIRNNLIIQLGTLGSQDALAWFDSSPGDMPTNIPPNVVWSNNTYYVPNTSQTVYKYDWQHVNFSTWQGTHGLDSGSTQNTGAAPTGAAPTVTPTAAGGTAAPTSTPTVTPSATPTAGPYAGTRFSIAATGTSRLQAAHFDWGANNTAYYDTTVENFGGSTLRATSVDVKDFEGGQSIGFWETGEWLNYAVNVPSSGFYTITVYGATQDANRLLRVELGAATLAVVTMPVTVNWQTYTTVTVSNIFIPSGDATLQLENIVNGSGVGGYLDVAWVEFSRVSGVTATVTPTQTPSITPTPSATFTPSATHTPSITPTPAPSLTATATLDEPALLATARIGYDTASDAAATANANVSASDLTAAAQSNIRSTRRAQRLDANATLSAADATLSSAIATANAP